MQQDAAARPYKGGEDILPGIPDEPDAVRLMLKSSEEAQKLGPKYETGAGPD